MTTGPASRRLRSDATRNTEKILRATREAFAEAGPDASVEDIAARAGVGVATVYRRFPKREELVRAALEQSLTEALKPALEQALNDDDPRRGIVTFLDATVSIVARDYNIMAAANNVGAITGDIVAPILDPLVLLTRQGQQTGLIRADLVPADVFRILLMMISVVWSMEPQSEGWRRYIDLIMDALSPLGATTLTVPASPIAGQQHKWPL